MQRGEGLPECTSGVADKAACPHPGAVGPCPSDATAGPVSGSAQPCPARPWVLLNRATQQSPTHGDGRATRPPTAGDLPPAAPAPLAEGSPQLALPLQLLSPAGWGSAPSSPSARGSLASRGLTPASMALGSSTP